MWVVEVRPVTSVQIIFQKFENLTRRDPAASWLGCTDFGEFDLDENGVGQTTDGVWRQAASIEHASAAKEDL